ncbi:MAG: hypothetical protein DRQ06_06365 [Candidatus Hydrothermota bacterium]|nr:MAG: hypothetical protein DRQ06_06365 [Candidatus Hydrothermae bacterium]
MIKIYPFRGIRYNPEEVNPEEAVVRLEFMKRDFYNHWRGIGKYSVLRFYRPGERKAREEIENFMRRKILLREEKPSIYVYHQIFPIGGSLLVRKSFIAVMRLVDIGEGKVLPHEETFPGGKRFHLNLMEGLTYNIEQVLSLYSDPEGEIQDLLDKRCKGDPELSLRDPFGTDHLLWKVDDAEAIERVQVFFKDKNLVIADGHHRYEASLTYRDRYGRKNPMSAPNFRQMAFTNVFDPGLVILPTHRTVRCRDKKKLEDILKRLSPHFEIERVESDKLHLLGTRRERHLFGLYLRNGESYLLKLKDESKILPAIKCRGSDNYKKLDVVILHAFILPEVLGVKGDDETQIDYIRETEKAIEVVDNGEFDVAFLLQPTPPWMVKEIAEAGEKMPHKSTDFYPKLTAGLLLFDISPHAVLEAG